MALDPRIRVELERRGPVNVKELVRTLAGPGPNAPVAVQLAEVPDPIRTDVEDWLREKEQEAEAVSRDTLKWAKIAGLAAIIGAVVTAFIGIASIVVTQHIARRAAAPIVVATGTRIKAMADSDIYTLEVYFKNSDGRDDATALVLTPGAINPTTKEAKRIADSKKFARLSSALWDASTARFTIRKNDLPTLLVICISYSDDSGDTLAPDVDFYAVPSTRPLFNGADVVPQSVPAEERDTLSAWFSCTKMTK